MSLLPLKTAISDVYPAPDNNTARAGFAALWDAVNEATEAPELDLASAATVNIGGQLSTKLRITGTTGPITSLGTTYRGPILLRFAGAVPITHNATTLILPGGANLTTSVGGTLIAYPKATSGTADGWIVAFSSDYFAKAGANSTITSLTGLTNMSAFFASAGSTASAAAVATNYTEAFDVNGDFNPATGVFTVPVAGIYEFGASGQLNINAGRGMVTIIRVNGTNVASGAGCTEVANASPINIRTPVTYLASLATGNTVDVQLSLTGTGYTAGTCDYFWGKRIL